MFYLANSIISINKRLTFSGKTTKKNPSIYNFTRKNKIFSKNLFSIVFALKINNINNAYYLLFK